MGTTKTPRGLKQSTLYRGGGKRYSQNTGNRARAHYKDIYIYIYIYFFSIFAETHFCNFSFLQKNIFKKFFSNGGGGGNGGGVVTGGGSVTRGGVTIAIFGFFGLQEGYTVAIRVFMCMKKNIPTVTVLALYDKSNLGLKVHSSRVARYRYRGHADLLIISDGTRSSK